MRQRNIANLRPGILKHLATPRPESLNFIWHPVHTVFAGNADHLTADITRQGGLKIRNRQIRAGAVFWIMTAHCLQHDRCIPHILGHRTCLIQRRCKRNDTPSRAPPVGRLDPRDTDKSGRLTDRSTRIRAGCRQTQIGGHGRGGPAGGSARCQRRVISGTAPRIDRIAIAGCLV